MKKKIIILIAIIVLVIFGMVILFQIDCQRIKTSKVVYSVGEKVSYSLIDFRLYRCEYGEDNVEFYAQKDNQWEFISPVPAVGKEYCLDGKQESFIGSPMCCGECKFFDKPIIKETREEEIKFYEKIADGPCKSFPTQKNKELLKDKPLPSYVSNPAPAGLYKIKFGKAEATFEIK
jgi:hypothetical protein